MKLLPATVKLRCRILWKAWLLGFFWGTRFDGHRPLTTIRYRALHLGPVVVMLETEP